MKSSMTCCRRAQAAFFLAFLMAGCKENNVQAAMPSRATGYVVDASNGYALDGVTVVIALEERNDQESKVSGGVVRPTVSELASGRTDKLGRFDVDLVSTVARARALGAKGQFLVCTVQLEASGYVFQSEECKRPDSTYELGKKQ